MRHLRTRATLALLVTALSGACIPATHHVRTMDARRAPRADTCDPATLPTFTDRGPERPRLAFAVVTAECGESKEPECRDHLLRGGCEVNADALIEVSNRVAQGRRRMVGTAVEFTGPESAAPAPSSGSAAP